MGIPVIRLEVYYSFATKHPILTFLLLVVLVCGALWFYRLFKKSPKTARVLLYSFFAAYLSAGAFMLWSAFKPQPTLSSLVLETVNKLSKISESPVIQSNGALFISRGKSFDCLPFPSIKTLNENTVYENGKPAFGGMVVCEVDVNDFKARLIGAVIAGPAYNSYSIVWNTLQFQSATGSFNWDASADALTTSESIQSEFLTITFNRDLVVDPAIN